MPGCIVPLSMFIFNSLMLNFTKKRYMCSKYRDQYGAKAIGLRGATYQGQALVLGGKSASYDAVGNKVGFGIRRSAR